MDGVSDVDSPRGLGAEGVDRSAGRLSSMTSEGSGSLNK
jgi:hypothetical protein